jgi:hypothetical protein
MKIKTGICFLKEKERPTLNIYSKTKLFAITLLLSPLYSPGLY